MTPVHWNLLYFAIDRDASLKLVKYLEEDYADPLNIRGLIYYSLKDKVCVQLAHRFEIPIMGVLTRYQIKDS